MKDVQLESQKTAVSCGPATLNGPHLPLGKWTSDNSDFIFRPRQVVLQTSPPDKAKRGNGRTLVKSYSLPPIHGSRGSSAQGGTTAVQARLVNRESLQTSKKTSNSTVSLRRDRALIWRQKEDGQFASTVGLICSSLATFTVTKCTPEDAVKTLSQSALDHSSKILHLEEKTLTHRSKCMSLLAKGSGVITEGIKNSASVRETKRHTQPLSDSAIETETQSSHRNGGMTQEGRMGVQDDQEEEYYTRQRIAEWVIGVNACLFSSSKDELNTALLKEEDVDTIKIVYGQD